MAKRSTKSAVKTITKYNKKLAAAAGIFAAGSLIGASVDLSSVPAYFEVIRPSSVVTVYDETQKSAGETVQTPASGTSGSSVTEHLWTTPEEYVPLPETAPEPSPVPEPAPAVTPQPVPSPEPLPEPETEPEMFPEFFPGPPQEPENKPENDWMEGIFVPSTPVTPPSDSPAVSEPDDWMDTEWSGTPPSEPAGQTPPAAPAEDTSSMTEELAAMLENVAVFWSPSGGKIHLDPSCRSFGTICFTGTLEEAQTVRTDGWCRWCAEHLDGTDNSVFYVKGNVYASSEQLLRSYTYSDYLNKIPSDAFGG